MKLGIHIATAGDLLGAPARAQAMGAKTIQIFSSNPRSWRPTDYTEEQGRGFQAACKQAGIDPVWIHMIYLVSYGTPDDSQREKTIQAMHHTLASADTLGVKGVITHMGSHKGLGLDQAMPRITDAIHQSLDGNAQSLFIMENSAGGGGSIGATLEELATILEAMKGHQRMAVCIDTAHALTSGYDLRTVEGLHEFLDQFDRLIGLDRLALMHLNDSKADLGSHVDRHENIGDGFLGTEAFAHIINHPKLANISGILEVPGLDGKSGPDKPNLDRLKKLIVA